jgi:hypothetical protein
LNLGILVNYVSLNVKAKKPLLLREQFSGVG